jgi:hypothetical protein
MKITIYSWSISTPIFSIRCDQVADELAEFAVTFRYTVIPWGACRRFAVIRPASRAFGMKAFSGDWGEVAKVISAVASTGAIGPARRQERWDALRGG